MNPNNVCISFDRHRILVEDNLGEEKTIPPQ